MSKNYADMAIEILHATRDGEDLAPCDLYLVQTAVNGWLNEAGDVLFVALYANVTKEEGYTRPWFWGIEHLTKDHEGFVYWKGIQVEHYSYRDADGEHAAALELAHKCQHLEAIGVKVCCKAVVWEWELYAEVTR